MPDSYCTGITGEQRLRIAQAVESTCELCHEYIPLTFLELHGFPEKMKRTEISPKTREQHILVVCEPCHSLIHREPVPVTKLRRLVARRPFFVRKEILSALGYICKPITVPDDQDLSRVYEDTIKEISGHYR